MQPYFTLAFKADLFFAVEGPRSVDPLDCGGPLALGGRPWRLIKNSLC